MELRLDNKGIISELCQENIVKATQLIKLEEHVNRIQNEILHNKMTIQSLCDHKLERESEYGKRTQSVCYMCGLNT